MSLRCIYRPCLAALLVLEATAGFCQSSYPSRPIRIVTSAPGGAGDFVSRIVGQAIAGPLGQQLIVDNRAAGVVQADIVSKAPPDGYTLFVSSNILWLLPFMRKDLPYDPLRDFAPVSLSNTQPNVLIVHPSVQAKSVAELIALAKAKPGALNYASVSTGSSSHLSGELFKAMAKIDILRVNYKGLNLALNDMIGGQMQVMFPNAASVTPHIQAGRLRALAVTSAEPSPLLPGLPTVAASGLSGYESISIFGFFVPAKTPAVIVTRLNKEIVKALSQPDIKQKFFNAGSEAWGSTPEEFKARIKSDMAKWSKVIKDAGIRDD